MLLQFTVENFQSIKKRTTLDMISVGGKEITEFKDSLIDGKLLPVSVIYGPNGGGKSTLLRAFQTFQGLLGRYFSNLGGIPLNRLLPAFQPTPFKFDKESINKPTSFEVVIALGAHQYKYGLSIFQGRIVKEFLHEKNGSQPTILFNRESQSVEIVCPKILTTITNVMASKVASDMPLLVFIKQFYDVSPIKEIVEWFLKTFYVDYNFQYQEEDLMLNIVQSEKIIGLRNRILAMLKDMGVSLDDYSIEQKQQLVNTPFGQEIKMSVDIKTIHKIGKENYTIPFRFESNGTQKLFGLVPLFISSLTEGRAIFVDELDAKLHPKLLENIIRLYTNKKTNTGGGQLIFTSHDMTTMNPSIFRRDEIYFMSLSEHQDSELFSLVEIRGKDGRVERNDGSFSKRYLEGRYGADPYFTKMKSW